MSGEQVEYLLIVDTNLYAAHSAQEQFGQKGLEILGIRLICRSIVTTDEVLITA